MTTPASSSIRSVRSTQGRRIMATWRGERRSSSAASDPAMRKMSSEASSWTTSITSSTVMVPISRFWSSTTGTVTRSYFWTTCATSSLSMVALTLTTSSPSRMERIRLDRKSTRLNSSHVKISYAVFCLKKKKKTKDNYFIIKKKKKKKKKKKT